MRYSHSKGLRGAYFRVPVLISIALGYLDWDNNLIGTYKAVILYYYTIY